MNRVILLLLLLACCQLSLSQSCPPNIDFESGTFNHWDCFTGTTRAIGTDNVIDLLPSSPTPGRHEIISDPLLKDPYGKFPQLCPYGGKYSVKLGNNNTGAEAEGVSYTFTVPDVVDTFTFTYFYAVVFEDPGHDLSQQPRFFVTAYDVLTGDLINCASYNYISTSNLPGFKKGVGGVLYKEWSPVSIQFAGLRNRVVRLEFKTADCTQSGHFGYAYLDVGTGCSNILATAPYCRETNSIILNAPYGYKEYIWWNSDYSAIIGTQQLLTLSPPPATSGRFYVDIIPYPGFGCRDTASAEVVPLPVPPQPSMTDTSYCQYDPPMALEAMPIRGNDLLWYTSSTGGTGSADAFTPSTALPGITNYYVTQKSLFGCESFRKELKVRVTATPSASFTINNSIQCQYDGVFIFNSTSTNLDNPTYIWSYGDGKTDTATIPGSKHTYDKYGNSPVKLKVINQSVCATEKTTAVQVVPRPLAAFSFPDTVCQAQTSVLLKDLSHVPASLSMINTWWWEINGIASSSPSPSSFIPSTPGSLPVKLVVTTPEGCRSDTSKKTINVHYQPVAQFNYNNLLCNNETILFNNLSSLPDAAFPENINRWHWSFDNNLFSKTKSPALLLPTGQHTARITAETNFGCRSTELLKAFTVYPKPNIHLQINDSCVYRDIYYTATDLDKNVVKWSWDFGRGFQSAGPLIHKRFTKEGPSSFVLVAESGHACKDTTNRSFTIFDNKAFAGRDTIAAKGEPVLLISKGGPNVTYTWSPATGLDNSALENPTATLDQDMLYILDAITDKGCDSHSKIFIKRYAGPELYIPNAFTPNGDGTNDELHVFPVGIKSFGTFSIYSRAGQLLFQTKDYHKGWDGMFNGVKMNNDNYIAVATAVDYRGRQMMQKESVMLLK
jgi:gliding motility-associated-like protein